MIKNKSIKTTKKIKDKSSCTLHHMNKFLKLNICNKRLVPFGLRDCILPEDTVTNHDPKRHPSVY